jgi:hypothetical protein
MNKKLASLAVATVIGAALIAAPAQAQRFGMRGGGGFAAARAGGFSGGLARGPAFAGRSAFVGRSGFVGRPGFVGRAGFVGRSGFVGRPFVNRAFFPGRRFARRGFGAPFLVGAAFAAGYGYSSCWSWVPTYYGLQRVWVCDSPYVYAYSYY